MIRAVRSPGRLVIRGHAGTAPKGQDLVCAAVSILTETLRAVLPEGAAEMGEGFGAFRFSEPCPEADFVCAGLKLLAESFPENAVFSCSEGFQEK